MELTSIINIADLQDPDDKLGRTYRQINNDKRHKYHLGDSVIYGRFTYGVSAYSRDCDGTPLYELRDAYSVIRGVNEEDLVYRT